jgi:hypothetical protein
MGPIGPRGEREEAGLPGGHGLQQGRPLSAFRKSSCRVTSLGQHDRPDRRAWPRLWLPPGAPTPSCKAARAGPASWQAAIAQRLARRTHTSPMAIGRTPRPPGFARVMRAEACSEGMSGRQLLMIRFISRRTALVAVGEVPVAAQMIVRPPA